MDTGDRNRNYAEVKTEDVTAGTEISTFNKF